MRAKINLVLILALSALVLAAPALAGGKAPGNAQVIRAFYRAVAAGDNQGMLAALAPGYQIVDLGAIKDKKHSKISEGDPDITKRIAYLHRALPGFTIEVKTVVSQGRRAFAHVVLSGVQKGEFLGVAPTNKKLTMIAFVLFEFEKGRIKRACEMWNQLGLMMQMGYIKISD